MVNCPIRYLTVCSEYLVSGLNGVEDTALTASSQYKANYAPSNARLRGNSSWSSEELDDKQYIQLFTGNSDQNTVVKSSLVPSITAVYVRINPRSWNIHISLRFDIGGFYGVKEKKSQSEFYRLPMLPSADLDQHLVFDTSSRLLPNCGILCHRGELCFSFTFDTNQNTCRGYNSSVTTTSFLFTGSTHYFVNAGLLTSLGFQILSKSSTFYRVTELELSQTGAADVCTQQYSGLMRIKSEAKMLNLQNVIAENTILATNHSHLFVSGTYVLPEWKYTDASEVIDSVLWSPGNPDPSQGHCVMMTPTGLESVDCTAKLFSICEIF
ncbi:uncharacterized protein LOC117338368 isoform X2 [Pecten maximus]|uniref:uncharacterized protein LOC117338368 isoform X2 n=1 Tax=Pecten maximus TaxID=6579 RepID=UPI00145833AA|nr:uncharacterized protein LOC117338368 isoform X2 [Pecten maximus]